MNETTPAESAGVRALLREALACQLFDPDRAHDEILFLGRLADRGLILAPRDRTPRGGEDAPAKLTGGDALAIVRAAGGMDVDACQIISTAVEAAAAFLPWADAVAMAEDVAARWGVIPVAAVGE